MRNKIVSTLLLLLPALLSAQERVTVKGRIVNEQGDAVEYVQVGVPKRQIGTISTVDGHFEIAVPCDTLEFFHVSYMPAAYPVTGPADDVVIVLREQELPPAVFIGGNTKEKYLVHPGLKINEKIGISLTNLSLLKTGKGRAIRFSTLNKLCKVLECLPGDILDYQPDPEGTEMEDDIYAD